MIKPKLFCIFATALPKANYIFGWGVCVVIHLHLFFDEENTPKVHHHVI